MVRLLNAEPVIVPCSDSDGLKLSPAALEAAITPKTRWLIINSPTNPSGAVYSAAELRALADVLQRHPDVLILSDDIYEHIVFDGITYTCFASAVPALRDRIVTVNGVSKAYAMTGWRIGYAAGPKWIIDAMGKVQSHTIGCSSAASQVAAAAALDGPQDFIASRTAEYQLRRDRVMALLADVPGLRCHRPEGAFYLFVNWSGLAGMRTPAGTTLRTDSDLAEYFISEGRVVVIPGEAFSVSQWFRLSIATGLPVLEEACGRIGAAVAKLSRG
jgi:aspartate aminotransferase